MNLKNLQHTLIVKARSPGPLPKNPTVCCRCKSENSAEGYFEHTPMRATREWRTSRIGICRKHKQSAGSRIIWYKPNNKDEVTKMSEAHEGQPQCIVGHSIRVLLTGEHIDGFVQPNGGWRKLWVESDQDEWDVIRKSIGDVRRVVRYEQIQ